MLIFNYCGFIYFFLIFPHISFHFLYLKLFLVALLYLMFFINEKFFLLRNSVLINGLINVKYFTLSSSLSHVNASSTFLFFFFFNLASLCYLQLLWLLTFSLFPAFLLLFLISPIYYLLSPPFPPFSSTTNPASRCLLVLPVLPAGNAFCRRPLTSIAFDTHSRISKAVLPSQCSNFSLWKPQSLFLNWWLY